MPHVDDNFDEGIPTSPPREQGPIPKASSERDKQQPQRGLLPTLSVMDYEPDQRLVEAALGGLPGVESSNGNQSQLSKFEQPQF